MRHKLQLPPQPKARDRAVDKIAAEGASREVRIVATADAAELFLYSEIGYWGITAQAFADALNAVRGKSVTVRINSPGGDVFDGLAMYSLLANWPNDVAVQVDGLAASAASVVMLGAKSITMTKGAFVMIHNAWGVAVGNASDMRDFAAVLDTIDGELADLYAARTGQTKEQMLAYMAAETWFNAEAALEAKLIDKVVEAPAAQASLQAGLYRNAPKALTDGANRVRATMQKRLDLIRRA